MSGFDASRVTTVRALSTVGKAFALGACTAVLMAQGGRPPLEIHRSAEMQAETQRMMEIAMRPGRDGTCFGSQLSDRPHGDRIAQATVLVAVVNPDNRVIFAGTGTIVAGSGAVAGSSNRILTAEHVISEARATKGVRIAIAGSDGRFLALAEPAGPSTYAKDPEYRSRGDIAVLVPSSFMPEGKAAYEAIKGLEIAVGTAPSTSLSGLVGLPAGIDHGVSGAGIIDGEGRIRGVVTTGRKYDETLVKVDPVAFTSGDIMAMSMAQDGVFRTAERSLPGSGTFFGETLSSDHVASLTGRRDALPGHDGPAEEGFIATVAGFPSLSCVAYEAIVTPSPSADSEAVSYRSPAR